MTPLKQRDQTGKNPPTPQTSDLSKEKQREKAEQREVAGRHKGDGQKDHKGRR
ncbi:MAG: hypothetical protein ABI648_10865 [Betaproteobacteria bacterium]|jgi:hypothetical protein